MIVENEYCDVVTIENCYNYNDKAISLGFKNDKWKQWEQGEWISEENKNISSSLCENCKKLDSKLNEIQKILLTSPFREDN